jgi:hypothetical protein
MEDATEPRPVLKTRYQATRGYQLHLGDFFFFGLTSAPTPCSLRGQRIAILLRSSSWGGPKQRFNVCHCFRTVIFETFCLKSNVKLSFVFVQVFQFAKWGIIHFCKIIMQHRAYFIIIFSVFVLKIYADCPHQRAGLQKWSTWSQKPTQTMQNITVPSGTSILLDESPPLMFYLRIEGELIFDERNLTLDAHFIYLMNGGHLWIGNRLSYTHFYSVLEIPSSTQRDPNS